MKDAAKTVPGIILRGFGSQMYMKQMEGETSDCKMDYCPLDFNKK